MQFIGLILRLAQNRLYDSMPADWLYGKSFDYTKIWPCIELGEILCETKEFLSC